MGKAQPQSEGATMLDAIPGVRVLDSRTAIIDFFELVIGERLAFPAVVVTRSTREDEPFIPLAELQSAVGEFADVYYLNGPVDVRDVVARGPSGHDLTDVNVYGGATRVFPAGRWNDARIFLARTPSEGQDRVRHITGHLKTLGAARGSVSYTTSTASAAAADEVHRASASVRVVDLEADNAALRQEVTRLTNAASKQHAPRPKAPVTAPVPTQKASRRMFADAGDEIRFRVMALWAEQTTPQEKLDSPLPRYTLGPEFASTLETLGGSNAAFFDKVARLVLRILLGQDRDGHKLDITGKVPRGRCHRMAVVRRTEDLVSETAPLLADTRRWYRTEPRRPPRRLHPLTCSPIRRRSGWW